MEVRRAMVRFDTTESGTQVTATPRRFDDDSGIEHIELTIKGIGSDFCEVTLVLDTKDATEICAALTEALATK